MEFLRNGHGVMRVGLCDLCGSQVESSPVSVLGASVFFFVCVNRFPAVLYFDTLERILHKEALKGTS